MNNHDPTDISVFVTDDAKKYGELRTAPTPNPIYSGYTFGGWFADQACTEQWNFSTYTLTTDNGVADASTVPILTLYARWYNFTLIVTEGGKVDVDGIGTFTQGTYTMVVTPGNIKFTATPGAGYDLISIVRGVDKFLYSPATISVNAEDTIIVTFDVKNNGSKMYHITAASDPGSTINPSGVVRAESGSNKTFTFSATDGYIISSVIVDGIPLTQEQTDSGSYTFYNVNMDHTIYVKVAIGSPSPGDPDDPDISDQADDDTDLGFLWWIILLILLILILIMFLLRYRSYEVTMVVIFGTVDGKDRARRKKPYVFIATGETVTYRVGEDGAWKALLPEEDDRYVIPKKEVVDKITIEVR
jgi:hypothetical protein